jgi:predicted acylesterase/phospholipase RssA
LLRSILVWIRRLPLRFTLPFAVCFALCLVLISLLFAKIGVQSIARFTSEKLHVLPVEVYDAPWSILIRTAIESAIVLLLLTIALLAAYNAAALCSRALRTKPKNSSAVPTADAKGARNGLERFERIGIVCAGGGAKGAYQAGALLAIHEFLEEHGALERVRMIAGTSIGSWNAMFWLAGLVKRPAPGQPSAHEDWWRSISLASIVEFDGYWPRRQNHLVLSDPWREAFRRIFAESPAVRARLEQLFARNDAAQAPIHFYFTRSNVEQGHLEFSTNRVDLGELRRGELRPGEIDKRRKVVPTDRYLVVDRPDEPKKSRALEEAVFASMDLPPLFPYARLRTDREEFFEDGGVIDNLPMSFATQLEQCDLIFVLPLNASFNAPVERKSIARRIGRVLDVRQGVLERNSLKLAYLYNELAGLRRAVQQAKSSASAQAVTTAVGAAANAPVGAPSAKSSIDGQDAAMRAMAREHKPVSVFAICPGPPLAIDTSEFWKKKEAARAFELMYAETKAELADRFADATDPDWIRMAVVAPEGGRTYVDEF